MNYYRLSEGEYADYRDLYLRHDLKFDEEEFANMLKEASSQLDEHFDIYDTAEKMVEIYGFNNVEAERSFDLNCGEWH